jgi:hypothetical protein
MIPAAGTMQPLPVRPIDTMAMVRTPALLHVARTERTMHPLPVPAPDAVELVDALRQTAFQRMLDRIDVQLPD